MPARRAGSHSSQRSSVLSSAPRAPRPAPAPRLLPPPHRPRHRPPARPPPPRRLRLRRHAGFAARCLVLEHHDAIGQRAGRPQHHEPEQHREQPFEMAVIKTAPRQFVQRLRVHDGIRLGQPAGRFGAQLLERGLEIAAAPALQVIGERRGQVAATHRVQQHQHEQRQLGEPEKAAAGRALQQQYRDHRHQDQHGLAREAAQARRDPAPVYRVPAVLLQRRAAAQLENRQRDENCQKLHYNSPSVVTCAARSRVARAAR